MRSDGARIGDTWRDAGGRIWTYAGEDDKGSVWTSDPLIQHGALPSGEETIPAGQTPVDSHAEDGETGAVCPKTPSPTDIQERETIARIEKLIEWFVERHNYHYGLSPDGDVSSPEEDHAHEAILTLRAILALRSNPQPGSEGWKLVPVEPADEMLSAPDDHGVGLYSREVFKIIYRAMLAASPTPPTAQPGEVERLRSALERIERWFGEFPDMGRTWPDGSPMSYAAAYGSNGERDYMRQVARAALTSSESQEAGMSEPQKPMTRREAKRWVRLHWQQFMRGADCPDLRHDLDGTPLNATDAELIATLFCDESARLAARLNPPSESQSNG